MRPDDTGRLRGDLTVAVPATRDYELRGCEGDPLRSCTTTLRRDLTNQLIGVSFDAESAGTQNATLSWVFDPPSIGFVDLGDSVCNVQEIFRGMDFADAAQTVPMATFRGSAPFTLGFDGQLDWSEDQHGKPALLHTSWKYFLTLEPV